MRRLPFRVGVAVVVLAALTGCASSSGTPAQTPPTVTFAAGQANVVAKPTQYCDIALTSCANDPTAPVTLVVPVGTPLRVSVPEAIKSSPWQVAFTYRDATGAAADARSSVFTPGSTGDYTLQLPEPGDRLLGAQVQQFGPPPEADEETGEIQFPIRASWVLTATAS